MYKKGTRHTEEPWNWTGWIARWKRRTMWDPSDNKRKFVNNRFFLGFRGGEVQNNWWDYHPYDDVEDDDDLESPLSEKEECDEDYHPSTDKYKGGYFYPDNSWGRYLHINAIKSHVKEKNQDFKRYSWIVHPLAYRDWLNRIPDNTVDAMQWSIMNINTNEPHYQDKSEGWNVCLGLELFNDFTYIRSYNSDPAHPFSPLECPDFEVPCNNGEVMNVHSLNEPRYVWWFNTYPLEYAEFLLVTSLSRGVWMHPLAANDVGYQVVQTISDSAGNVTEQVGTLMGDSKYHSVKKQRKESDIKRKLSKVAEHLEDQHEGNKTMTSFTKGFPYGIDTAFGYTTLIDPRKELKKHSEEIYSHKLEDPNFGMNKAELDSFDMLIEGQHFGHTGVYGLFDYSFEPEGKETFPIQIQGQRLFTKPCYQMTKDMDMVFTFHPVCDQRNSNFTYAPKDFVWKYELQVTIDDDRNNEVTVHGYFNLHAKVKTTLDLSLKYDKENLKWIRFTCFEPCSPQHRAWFIPIRGLAFGKPRHLFPRYVQASNLVQIPKMTHQIAIIEEVENKQADQTVVLKESKDYFDKVMAVESKDLKFYLEARKTSDLEQDQDNWMYCYFLEVCPHQQDLEQLAQNLNKTLDELKEIMDTELPPRIPQNVHGYFQLGSQRKQIHLPNYNHAKLPTRFDLCNHWDKETVSTSTFMSDEGAKEGKFIFFYAIDSKVRPGKQIKPVEINPKPRAIKATYNIGKFLHLTKYMKKFFRYMVFYQNRCQDFGN